MKRILITLFSLSIALTASAIIETNSTKLAEATIDGINYVFLGEYELNYDTATAKLITVTPKPINEIEIPSAILVKKNGVDYSFALKEICDGAFANARGLTKVKFSSSADTPTTIERIGDYAFSNCTALSSIELRYGIRYIGKRPFVNTIIPELTLPDSLLDMDGNIAAGAPFDIKLIISDSSHFTYSDDGVLYNKDMTKLYACPTRAEGTVIIPSSVTNICADAFFGCFRLTYLNIPENVNRIEEDAFNVKGIWPGLHAPESVPKLQYIFYEGEYPITNAAEDIYTNAPSSLTNFVFNTNWPTNELWKGRPVVFIPRDADDDDMNIPILSSKDNHGITWFYRIIKGTAQIYNEDRNKKTPIAAIAPKSISGVLYQEHEDSDTFAYALRIPHSLNGFAVTSIGKNAFDGCTALTCVGLPASVQKIGDNAFKGCTALRSIDEYFSAPFYVTDSQITLPVGITTIGNHAFEGATVTSIFIPYTLTTTIGNPLAGLDHLTTVEVDSRNSEFSANNNVLYDKQQTTVIGVPKNYNNSSTSIYFPVSVKKIGTEALYGCKNLQTIRLPDYLETISPNAFSGCSNIKSIIILETVTEIGEAAFTNCTSLTNVTYSGNIPQNIDTNIYNGATNVTSMVNNSSAEIISNWVNSAVITNTITTNNNNIVTTTYTGSWMGHPIIITHNRESTPSTPKLSEPIGDITWYYSIINGTAEISAVESDKPIMSLSLPDTLGGYIVKGIGDGALSNLRGITTISVPNTYEWIGDNAFSNCTSLAAVSLGSGIEMLGRAPFYGTKITTLAIPGSVSEIDGNPVAGCPLMQAITATDSQPYFSVDDGILYDKQQETIIACPATKISVTLPESLKVINDKAFAGCAGITSIAIPAAVEEICSAAFTGCTSLTKVEYNGNAPAANDDIYAGTPETMASWIKEGATGFSEGTWKGRPVVVHDPNGTEMSYNNGIATWYFRVIDEDNKIAEIWRNGNTTAIESDNPIMNLSLPDTLSEYIVKGIGDGALSNLRGITSISVPNTYEWIGDYAFSNCTSLAAVSLGNGVERIGRWPFFGTKLTTLAIPVSVSAIDGNPVAGCPLMQTITATDLQPYFSVDDGILYDKRQETMIACPATKTSISFPDTLETINDDALYGCNLTMDGLSNVDGVTWSFKFGSDGTTITGALGAEGLVTIPATLNGYSVTDIADGAFAGSSNITAFATESEAFMTRGGILYSADGTELICVPDTIKLPYYIITSNTTMTVKRRIEAGVANDLPYTTTSSTTNKSSTKVSAKSMKGDISFSELINGVTKIRDYAFTGVNVFADTSNATCSTNSIVSGQATPGDGTAYADVTLSITISSVTHFSPVHVPNNLDFTPNAFSQSGLSYEPLNAYTRLVTFNANGGTVPEVERVVVKDTTVGTLPTPIRKGYRPKGWYTAKKGGTKIKTTTKVKKNVTYYAQWMANKYKIKFNANGGRGTMKTISATYGKTVTLTANAFKRTNWTFLGWAVAKDAATVDYANKAKVKNLSSGNDNTVTLYALWRRNTYTVKFDANGGIGSAQKQTINCGSYVKLMNNVYTREGFVFAGWATKKTGAVIYKNNVAVKDITKRGKSTTLYAVWKPASWAVGTFTGNGTIGGDAAKVTLTVASSGKISGKFVRTKDSKSVSFKANAFTEFSEGALRATTKITYGKKSCELDIAVAQNELSGETFAELLVIYAGNAYGEASVK